MALLSLRTTGRRAYLDKHFKLGGCRDTRYFRISCAPVAHGRNESYRGEYSTARAASSQRPTSSRQVPIAYVQYYGREGGHACGLKNRWSNIRSSQLVAVRPAQGGSRLGRQPFSRATKYIKRADNRPLLQGNKNIEIVHVWSVTSPTCSENVRFSEIHLVCVFMQIYES